METLSFWSVPSVPGAVLRAGVQGVDSLGATGAEGSSWVVAGAGVESTGF